MSCLLTHVAVNAPEPGTIIKSLKPPNASSDLVVMQTATFVVAVQSVCEHDVPAIAPGPDGFIVNVPPLYEATILVPPSCIN